MLSDTKVWLSFYTEYRIKILDMLKSDKYDLR